MVLGLLKPLLSPSAPLAPASSTSLKAQQASTPQTPAPQGSDQLGAPEGVRFDLSDNALKLVEDASVSSAATPTSAAREPSPASPTPAASAPKAAVQSEAAPKPAARIDRPVDATDPSEEQRARAWAIRGMESEKLLGLVDALQVTPKADPAVKEVAEYTAAQPHVRAAPLSDRVTAA